MEPGQTFNTVASIYDAQRSGYPEALFDDLLRISRLRPGDRVLEVGCGTGQATAGFAARGLRVVATDPGDRLLDIARPKFDQFPNVQFEISSFEDWPLGERSFHLVAAAQSWHWVRPEVGFEKASRALSPGGHLAIFGHTPRWSPEIVDALQPVYVRFAPEIWGPPVENWYLPEGPISRSRCCERPLRAGQPPQLHMGTPIFLQILRSLSWNSLRSPPVGERAA